MTNEAQNVIQRDITAALDELQAGLDRAARAAAALDELQGGLDHASRATAAIRQMLPRVGALGALFDELEAVVRSGREQIGTAATGTIAPQTRPTMMIPSGGASDREMPGLGEIRSDESTSMPGISSELISFRIEFESAQAPLELRIIDEAVGEHAAVRDVALLDYDGRCATLKVWIDPATSPESIEESLRERLPELIGDGGTITITALDSAA